MPRVQLIDDALLPPPDGKPLAVMDWPEMGSPVPRLTIAIDQGRCTVRFNEAWRRLVLATAPAAATA
jgi:hypothetical protein